jgi:two-component system, OmpR family, alkaline phosphatase synthesis response regulator PhoP
MHSRILLIEDEPGLVLTLSDLLVAEGYHVAAARDGPTGLAIATSQKLDVIILDVMLPGKSGFEVCRDVRQAGVDVGILMLTAKTQVNDRVAGLQIGADDYVTKPFDPSELLARIGALLRRVRKENLAPVVRFQFGKVQADFEKGEVLKSGIPVSLAPKELQLLRYMIEHRGKVVTRDELLKNVWEYQAAISSRTVDVHVACLRHKLEDHPHAPRHIQTVRGAGYRFSP